MPTVGTTSKPAYVYDAGTDTWIPIGPGEHTHDYVEKSTLTTTGDLVYASAANTPARLGIGSSGQILNVSGGIPAWTTPKVVQIVNSTTSTQVISGSSTFADTNLTATITPTSASNKILVFVNQNGVAKYNSNTQMQIRLLRGATVILNLDSFAAATGNTNTNNVGSVSCVYLDSPGTTSATTYKTQFNSLANVGSTYVQDSTSPGTTSTILLMEVTP